MTWEPLSVETARAVLQKLRDSYRDEIDLLNRKLSATNASLIEQIRRAERAEAERDALRGNGT